MMFSVALIVNSLKLFYLDTSCSLGFGCCNLFWNMNVKYTMLHFCLNLAGIGIVGQYKCLLEFCVGEFLA